MALKNTSKIATALLSSAFCSLAYGSGFAIQEQSITGLGRAFAGSAAVADDGSTIFFNPAGLTQLKQREVDLAMNYIVPKSDFNNDGSRVVNLGGFNGLSGQAITGNDGSGAEGGKEAFVPNFYYVHPVNDSTVLGLGINAPFGLVTDYSESWPGRYHAVHSEMLTLNINPSVGHRLTDKLSIGFGISLQYIDVRLSQIADLGAQGGFPQAADGKIRLEGDDWSWGYNLGLTYQIQEATRIGLAYRSKISHSLEGDGKLWTSAGVEVADQNINADVDLPENLSLAVHHQLNHQWALSADVSWTRWNRFKTLSIKSKGGTFDLDKPENWHNTLRYGLGLDYQYNDTWTFRGGIAYDETPISNEFRTARIPGEDRKWVSLGASYKVSDEFIIDAAYTHMFLNDPKINELDSNGYVLSGDYDASVDMLGLQLRWLLP